MKFERFKVRLGDGCRLEAVRAVPRTPRALAIGVPLIGGTGQQQLSIWRHLVRRGVEVTSFTFRGHRGSEGHFSFPSTVTDAAEVIEMAVARAADQDLPVHLLGASYATIPLMLNLSAHPEWPVRSFVAISGFPSIEDLLGLFERFLSHYAQISGQGESAGDLVRSATTQPASLDEALFRSMLRDYLADRFPSISVSLERFEVLEYRRVNLIDELELYSQLVGEEGVGLRVDRPSLWIYARGDTVLELTDEAARRRYCQRVLSVAPQAEFYEAGTDHWVRGSDRDVIADRVSDFLFSQ